jgi:hypothetical protein
MWIWHEGAVSDSIKTWATGEKGKQIHANIKRLLGVSKSRDRSTLLLLAAWSFSQICPPLTTQRGDDYLQGLQGFDGLLNDEYHDCEVLDKMVNALHRVLMSEGSTLICLVGRFNSLKFGRVGLLDGLNDEYTAERTSGGSHGSAYDSVLKRVYGDVAYGFLT